MKRTLVMACAWVILAVGGVAGWAGGPDFNSIAHKMVNQLAKVQPGEVVVIQGSSDQQELLEALVVATWKAGGQPTVEVYYPKAYKKALMEMPIEYMKFPQWYGLAQARLVDCYINVASIQDPTLFADVPEERFKAVREAGMPLQRASSYSRFRAVNLGQTGGVPTAKYAVSKNVDFEALTEMFWKAVDTDYAALTKSAKSVAEIFASGEIVRVTSDIGTDITFLMDKVGPRVNCGSPDDNVVVSGPMMSWLPAGEVYAPIRSGSANGTVVVPSLDFRGSAIKNLKIIFKDGKMTEMTADSDIKGLRDFLDATTGDSTMLSIVDVGLNPDSQSISGSDFASWEMGGMVNLAMGNNSWAGGSITSSGSLTFHLTGATLLIGDTVVCERGKLKY